MPTTQPPSLNPDKASTNDLSASKGAPPQPAMFYPGMMGPGVYPPNMMCYPIPVGYVQGAHAPVMPLSMFNGAGGHHTFVHPSGVMSFPVPSQFVQNIPCQAAPTAGKKPEGNALTMTMCSGTSQPTLDSRNIAPNLLGPSPPSSEESKTL